MNNTKGLTLSFQGAASGPQIEIPLPATLPAPNMPASFLSLKKLSSVFHADQPWVLSLTIISPKWELCHPECAGVKPLLSLLAPVVPL